VPLKWDSIINEVIKKASYKPPNTNVVIICDLIPGRNASCINALVFDRLPLSHK
jgi:hypothetical protein